MKLIYALQEYRELLHDKHIGKQPNEPLSPTCSECQKIKAVDALIAAESARPEEQRKEPPTISASGNFPLKFFGTSGPLGTCLGMQVYADHSLPRGTIEIRDSITDRVLGRIINVGSHEPQHGEG